MNEVFNFLHHLLVPKEDNNFRAKALHLDFLTYYLITALLFSFIVKYSPLSNVLGYATDITVSKLFELTNQERQKNGLAALTLNDKLNQAASQKAQDMFAKNYWNHYGPDGKAPWDFILGSGYQYEYAGENLAKNFLFSQGVVDAWIKSPTHKENILRNNYSEIGFAIVNGTLNGEQTTLVVQMFGKPLGKGNSIIPPNNPIIPTVQPATGQETNAVIQSQPAVLAKQTPKKISLSSFSLNFNMIFIIFLLVALVFDFYFACRLNVIRLTGKNIAHFLFIGFIGIGLIILTRGAIL